MGSKVLDVNEKLGCFLDKLIFENNDVCIFDILNKSDKLYKYKYGDGSFLVDKVLKYYVDSLLCESFERAQFYSCIIFEILKRDNYRFSKVDSIIFQLRGLKSKLNGGKKYKYVMSFIDRLSILNGSLSKKDLKGFERDFDISVNFSSSIESIDDVSFSRRCNLVDRRDRQIITMDHKFKVSYDDAISIEKTDYGYLFGIYISDVTSFVGVESLLYEHARQRGESIYGDLNNSFYIPMFPREITKNLFSLNKGEDKCVVAYMFKFSDSFDLIDSYFENAIINVSNNYSFDYIDKFSKDDSNYDMIYLLMKLTDSLNFCFNGDYHRFKEKNKKVGYDNGVGSNIISRATIFLNTYIAELFMKYNWPYIYRVNYNIFDGLESDSDIKKFVKGSSFSRYSICASAHPVNNGRVYGHITNPIRSFASYVNQYLFSCLCLDSCDNGSFIDYWNMVLPDLVSELNFRLNKNKEFLSVLSELDRKSLTKRK